MRNSRHLVGVTLLTLAMTATSMAKTKLPTLREEAEHACYDDVMKLCNDAVPDEAKITACMNKKHKELSAGCAKLFDAGMK